LPEQHSVRHLLGAEHTNRDGQNERRAHEVTLIRPLSAQQQNLQLQRYAYDISLPHGYP
jgi:ssRNA-specific RNase YbeY (16S rRNA maturation enzyme)